MEKINYTNLLIVIAFILSIGLVIYDLINITINFNAMWTPYGVITFWIAAFTAELSYECLTQKKRK